MKPKTQPKDSRAAVWLSFWFSTRFTRKKLGLSYEIGPVLYTRLLGSDKKNYQQIWFSFFFYHHIFWWFFFITTFFGDKKSDLLSAHFFISHDFFFFTPIPNLSLIDCISNRSQFRLKWPNMGSLTFYFFDFTICNQ